MSEAKYTALIVDDNWYNRDIFRIALENAGYQVTEVDNGRAGLNLLEGKSFNLLVLDLQMPGIDGQTVLNTVRGSAAHQDMRIVVVTANAHMATDDVDNLADHVMYKPIDVVDFAQFTHRLIATFQENPAEAPATASGNTASEPIPASHAAPTQPSRPANAAEADSPTTSASETPPVEQPVSHTAPTQPTRPANSAETPQSIKTDVNTTPSS